jgi:acyl-coenzyme A synthetase/AMP-(fatty) acid ligase
MIKSAGNRISPTEIEEAVLAGGEAVEAVALGVPDPRLGHAIVVVARASGPVVEAEARLRERLRRDLPSFMQPARYDWRDALPRNANGKLDRVALKHGLTIRPEPVEGLRPNGDRGRPETDNGVTS